MAVSTPERDRLLTLVVDHVLAHGTSGLSLSGLARTIGSNNRMLLYYFGSKEQLVDEACRLAVDRFPRVAGALQLLAADGPLEDRLHAVWSAVAHPDNTPFLQLFFERYGVALRDPPGHTAFLERMGIAGWPAEVAAALRAEGFSGADARRCALELVALWRGLQLAVLSGVPRRELDAVHGGAVRRLVAGRRAGSRHRAVART